MSSYTSGSFSGISSAYSTTDGKKSYVAIIPESEPMIPPKNVCGGTGCIWVTIIVAVVLILTCTVAQMIVINQASQVLEEV